MKRKQVMNIVMLCFALAIMFISIGYAALKANLTITGKATVSGNWKVIFENLGEPTTVGNPDIKEVDLSATEFKLNVELFKPLDAVTYTFDVRNAGTIDAEVVTVVFPDLAALTANNLTYSFTYADGSAIKQGDLLLGNCKSTNLTPCTKQLKLSVKFNDVDRLEQNSMSLSLDSSILYQQAQDID